MKLERISFKKNNLIFLLREIRGNPIFKSNLFPANGNGLRTFFLLKETIIKTRQNSVFKKYSCQGKLIRGRRNGFSCQWKSCFSSFYQRLLPVFFCQVEKYFSTKSFISAGGIEFTVQWEAFSFAQSFSPKWKPSLKSMEGNI